MGFLGLAYGLTELFIQECKEVPTTFIILLAVSTLFGFLSIFYLFLFIAAPIPRGPLPSEKTFVSIDTEGKRNQPIKLPCWQDRYIAAKEAAQSKGDFSGTGLEVEDAEIGISVVVPAYNEDERLGEMLEEAVEYLQENTASLNEEKTKQNGSARKKTPNGKKKHANGAANSSLPSNLLPGWEILIVNDGSTDNTVSTALDFSKTHHLTQSDFRVVTLHENRGKGGAVTHGMRHVRGQYAVFADADGASKFEDLGKLITQCRHVEDSQGRGVAVGSRAHLVGSEAVVKRSFLRNLLMHSFHLLLRLLTPPATAAIKDTQCGFKLFSRTALPDIIPNMHSEGWIFDVEMLMLAESAGIPVAEVAVGWKEVTGSKLNVIWDSLGMAWGLAVLRAAWACGVYRRK